MKEKIENEELIAPCGMDCRICLGYFGYTVSGNKRKMKCTGCRQTDKGCSWVKKGCEKLTKKQIDFCYECEDMPCEKLQALDERYQKKYNMSMVENLKYIKEKGMEEFLKLQDKKYRCLKCDEFICVHNGICYNCEFDINAKKN